MWVGGDPTAYAELLCDLWEAGDGFLLVEHDVVLNAEALRAAVECTCRWGVAPYLGPTDHKGGRVLLTRSLGCTRFSAELIGAHRDAMVVAAQRADTPSVPPGDWRRLDVRLADVLSELGETPHLHPEVAHHHRYDDGCACGGDHG